MATVTNRERTQCQLTIEINFTKLSSTAIVTMGRVTRCNDWQIRNNND